MYTPEQWEAIYKWLDKHQRDKKFLATACRKWGGYTTKALRYRWKMRVLDEGRRGPLPTLTLEGERAFKEWLMMQQDVGNCVIASDLGKEAKKWGKELGIRENVGGRKWVQAFFERHPELSRRQSQLVEACRLTAMHPPAVERFFEIAAYALGENLPEEERVPAQRIYMMDECGVAGGVGLRRQLVRSVLLSLPARTLHAPSHASFTFLAGCGQARPAARVQALICCAHAHHFGGLCKCCWAGFVPNSHLPGREVQAGVAPWLAQGQGSRQHLWLHDQGAVL
jgi:hypothetical protein